LSSKYPAISHTFILREVLGLRALGMRIEACSINQPDRSFDKLTPDEREEAERTFFLKGPGLMRQHVVTLLRVLVTRPDVIFRGISAMLSYGGWDLKARAKTPFYLAEAILIGEWMRRRKLDHLHSHFAGAVAVVAMFMAAAYRKTFSFTVHGPDEYMDMRYLHMKHKSDAAKFVITISEFGRTHLLRVLGMAKRHHVTTVRLGVNVRDFQPALKIAERGAPVHMVCVGRLVRDKAQDVLLEALAILLHRGMNVRLTLVGDGAAARQFKQVAADFELQDHVTFTGPLPQPETRAILRTADLFVLPSFAEGIPVALMEAMAMEIPCVSTTVMGIPELIESGKDGILVPPGNVDELAAALETLIADPALRQKIGKAGRFKVAEQFNLDINVPKLQRAFMRHLAHSLAPQASATQASEASVTVVANKVPAA
jgi:glycosyltransferase involved in cell wall biosynthesis